MIKKLTICTLFSVISLMGYAQTNLTYQEPPESIVELIDAPNTPHVLFNPSGNLVLILEVPGFTSIEQASQPVLGLAGIRINPANNSTEGENQGLYKGVKLLEVKSGKEFEITGLPMNLRMGNLSWNPQGDKIAFTHNGFLGVELWVIDLNSQEAKRLTRSFLNDAFGRTLQWNPQGTKILAQFIPENRGNVPVKNPVPKGPIVQENLGVVTPSRTYQNLLENAYDERLMEYYLSSQLATVDMEGNVEEIGEPALYRNVSYSPNGQYLLTQTVIPPYSYLVPIYQFGYSTQLLDSRGVLVKALHTAESAENQPIGFDATSPGPRSYAWRGDVPATLVWVEAQDGGDPNKEASVRDVLYSLAAPFTSEPKALFDMQMRYGNVEWIDGKYALVREQWRKSRETKISLINPHNGRLIRVVSNRSSEDTYSDPGRFLQSKEKPGVLLKTKERQPTVFTIGNGASSEGDRPFLMKWNLLTGRQDTLFRSKAGFYEYPVYFNNSEELYISRESKTEVPNYLAINLRTKTETSITNFTDPYPSLKQVQKEQIIYSRKDGLKLTATLYLPAGYKKEDGPLPVLVWAYPREYKSAAAAGQVKGSPHRFTRLAFRSPVFWVTRGYAVLDEADMPIVGEGDQEPNDTFIEQIKDNAEALIDYIVERGVADRDRIAVGGHSYGAFMTANLLAHTDLFAAGIARSGAYNRTLTPFGFQSETRTFWQAPEVYGNMSPFNYADKIKTPLLLTHGMEDENSGTFPMQSERLYSAIKGHGGTVRLVMLPKEFHGYRSRESVLHTFWEQDRWLEEYVKNKKKEEAPSEEEKSGEE